MRNLGQFHQQAIQALRRAGEEGSATAGPEEALRVITETLPRLLGDREAHWVPGNLKEGEKPQFACGCFMVTPDGRSNLLVAPVNFAPTQLHMKIDIGLGHPGSVVKNRQPMLLANTDTHKSFVKILETFRAGSAVFAPLMWRGDAIGVIVCASQVRNTYNEHDLEVHVGFSHLAAALWIAHDGPAYLGRLAG